MIKCERGVVDLAMNKEDLASIYEIVPSEDIMCAMLSGTFEKVAQSTILASDLRCIFKSLVEDLGEDTAVTIITLALSHIVDELKENDDE